MKKPASRKTPQGEAMYEVLLGVLAAFFRLRGAGTRIGAVTPGGAGAWGLMRTLKLEGPQTVPQIARSRPVARQHIQKLADELAGEGFVEFAPNPHHRRSKLVRLTAKGEARHAEITERIQAQAEHLAEGMNERELRTAARVLRTLHDRLSTPSS